MEELNGRAEAELQALRAEQTEAAQKHLANESKRVAGEELGRVAREIAELKNVIAELEEELRKLQKDSYDFVRREARRALEALR